MPNDIEKCEKLGRQQYNNARGLVVSIHAFKEVEVDDLIWTRKDGTYYLCRVLSKWKYNNSNENTHADVVNTINVEFVEVGTI